MTSCPAPRRRALLQWLSREPARAALHDTSLMTAVGGAARSVSSSSSTSFFSSWKFYSIIAAGVFLVLLVIICCLIRRKSAVRARSPARACALCNLGSRANLLIPRCVAAQKEHDVDMEELHGASPAAQGSPAPGPVSGARPPTQRCG
jgi:hypothetical protein